LVFQRLRSGQRRFGARRRLPDAARDIGARIDAGDRAARRDGAELIVVQRIGDTETREIERSVTVAQRCVLIEPVHDAGNAVAAAGKLRHVEDVEGPALVA
jgi:hypothetical protein